jgi:hypothetical protein
VGLSETARLWTEWVSEQTGRVLGAHDAMATRKQRKLWGLRGETMQGERVAAVGRLLQIRTSIAGRTSRQEEHAGPWATGRTLHGVREEV